MKKNNKLIIAYKKTGGRNNYGRRTMRYIGGGHKRKYRVIDNIRNKFNIPAIVKSIEYDPNRSSFISLICYLDGEKRYILSVVGLNKNDMIMSSNNKIDVKPGNCMPVKYIPIGTNISSIEVSKGKGASIAKSAGTYASLLSIHNNKAKIKLPSGKIIIIDCNSLATVGIVSNLNHRLINFKKAGRSRWLGIRPRTRGVAMNPIDHPMGGGEGKASGGHPRSRNSIPSKGYKTVNRNK